AGSPPAGAAGGDVRRVQGALAPRDRPGRGEGKRKRDHLVRRRHGLDRGGCDPGRKAPVSAHPRCLTPLRPLLSFPGRSTGRRVRTSLYLDQERLRTQTDTTRIPMLRRPLARVGGFFTRRPRRRSLKTQQCVYVETSSLLAGMRPKNPSPSFGTETTLSTSS